jgi:hypothetical protein
MDARNRPRGRRDGTPALGVGKDVGVQIIEVSIAGVRSALLTLSSRSSSLTFVVYPMVHVADPAFYRQVQQHLVHADVVDGVGDSVTTRALTLTYRILPRRRRSGLVEQKLDYQALRGEVIRADMTGSEFTTSWKSIRWRDRALIWCIIPFFVVLGLCGSQRWLMQRSVKLQMDDLPTNQEVIDSEATEDLERVLVSERDQLINRALVEVHSRRQGERLTVAVVYGAGHVPAILDGLYRLGYRVQSGDWLTVMAASDR